MKKIICLLFLLFASLATFAASEEEFFARIVADRETVYAGDSMLVSVVLYASQPIAKAECGSAFKVSGNCRTRQLNINRDATAGRTREGRKVYYTLVWTQYVVAPQRTGTYTIAAQKFKGTLQQVVRMPDLFDQMMGARPEYRETKVKGESKTFTFEVKEKPLRSTQEMLRHNEGTVL